MGRKWAEQRRASRRAEPVSGGQRQGHFLLTAYSTALALVPYSFPRLLNPVKGTKMSTLLYTPAQVTMAGRYLCNLLPNILNQ